MAAMRRCLMKFQITGRPIAGSNFTGGLLSKQHLHHHHQLKLHGIRALSECPRGTSSSNPNLEPGNLQEHLLSSMKSEIEKLRAEIKMMDTKLQSRHIYASAKSSASSQLEEKRAMLSAKMEVISNYAKFIADLIEELLPAALGAALIVCIIMMLGLLIAMVTHNP